MARRLYRQPEVEGIYRLDEGAVWDACFPFLAHLGVLAWLAGVDGVAVQRAMLPVVQSVLRYGLKTRFGSESLTALPTLLCSDAALMRVVGFNAQQVRAGVCQRGAATRQGERPPGPIGPDTLAKNIVQWTLRDLEMVFKGALRALAKAGVLGQQVTGMADGTALETTARDRGCGQVTRTVRREDKHGRVHASAVTVYGWNVWLLIDAATKIPLAVTVGPLQAHEPYWTRAVVTQARANLVDAARLQKVVFARGFWDGTDLGWLDQPGIRFVVPAKANLAVTADARAPAAAGEALTVGRRGHPVRHGQGQKAWSERLETAVVGMTGLATDDPYGTQEQARHATRRDFQAHPINAVVGRQWPGQDDGPGGNTVVPTHASVTNPLPPFDDDDDRRLLEHCGIKAAKQPWELGHPPQETDRAVRVPVMCTLVMCALATADRRQGERAAMGGEPVGWQRWRRQRLEQTRDQVIVVAEGP